jgi:predicted nucleotidyltransferase
MDKSTVIAKLREHESELKAAGIEHLFLHGSYARGTAIREVSDVDVIAEFAPGRRLSLLDMVAMQNRLADMLGVRVDLSPAKGLKEAVVRESLPQGRPCLLGSRHFPCEISSTPST